MIDNKLFALGSYEINLQTSEERAYIFNNMSSICTYIDTAIDYNNDYLFKDVKNYKLISKIAPCHTEYYDLFVDNHLKCLNRDTIDIMLIHSSRGDWKPLAKKLNTDSRFKEVGVSNFNKQELIEYKNLIGNFPIYNEVEINPNYADLDTIEFCKNNNIKIISYGILGGKYNAVFNVAEYSLPYLILLACKYSDIVILRPDSFRQVNEFIDVVKNYTNLNFNNITFVERDNKSIVPMRYTSKNIIKTCLSRQTYNNACGHNKGNLEEEPLAIEIPNFEMLGDYATYLRYLYRTDYSTDPYYYDFLIGDDGNYYVVYLYDENNKITKVNNFNRVKFLRLKV